MAYAAVCIAFLHDIDKDLGLDRGEEIEVTAVAERMHRYGIDGFLVRHGRPHFTRRDAQLHRGGGRHSGCPKSVLRPTTTGGLRRHAATSNWPTSWKARSVAGIQDGGVDGLIASLRDPNRWPVLGDRALTRWDKVEIHDHLHMFLLDRFQSALSATCRDVSGGLPLIEIVHDGRLLCVIPQEQASVIKEQALDRFLGDLPYGLGFSVNNRLACEFVGGAASWAACRAVMQRTGDWRRFANLLALPRAFARSHTKEVDDLFDRAGMETSWSPLDDGPGATVKPALDHPGGDTRDLDSEPAHALAFLTIALNHADIKRKSGAPDAGTRERELLDLLRAEGTEPPPIVTVATAKDGRTRRVLLAMWTIAEVWRLAERDPNEAQEVLDRIVGQSGLIGLWLDGNDDRTGLSDQVDDVSSDILNSLRLRFSAYLTGSPAQPFDGDTPAKRCILCNEPVGASRNVSTASRAHGIKASAFSGRDGRNDHLASPSGDTHLCPVCLAELQLRQEAQEEFKGSGDLPPLISSPATTGLFGGLAFQQEDGGVSMGLNDLNRLDVKKGAVYEGLDCQRRRIRIARLETLPNKDAELVAQLRMTLTAIRRLGRPIHVFRGAPRRHPAIFHSDALPAWLERLLNGDSLRIEQLPDALSSLGLFENIANKPGLGMEWAKQLAEPDPAVRLGALCVAWGLAVDRRGSGAQDHAWSVIETGTRELALAMIRHTGGESVSLKNSQDPLIRLAWLASRIQRRRSARDSTNKQLLCWKTALDFYPAAEQSTTKDRTALILGLAGTLEEELTRKSDAAAKKHRDDRPLGDACIEFARHFATEVWQNVFKAKEPTSREQRRAAAIYRFALLEAYRERGIAEARDDTDDEKIEA